jgi:hypothetical protein
VGSVMRKLPPGMRFVSAIGAVMVAMVLLLLRIELFEYS